ncbi:MAG: nucleotide pyrophosphohydrolase [Candidatus Methanomethylophilaceae archaeon]|jgi:NTP pyrophosphatase (non-canonical NTP hydrolase)
MDDGNTNLNELKASVKEFCDAREWDEFHCPKNLAAGLITEASELLEIFRFKSDEEVAEMMKDERYLSMVRDELSDVFYFVLRFAQRNDIDLTSSLREKLRKNEERYPVETSRGSNRKYNEPPPF